MANEDSKSENKEIKDSLKHEQTPVTKLRLILVLH